MKDRIDGPSARIQPRHPLPSLRLQLDAQRRTLQRQADISLQRLQLPLHPRRQPQLLPRGDYPPSSRHVRGGRKHIRRGESDGYTLCNGVHLGQKKPSGRGRLFSTERRKRNAPDPDMPASVRKIRGLDGARRRAKVISFDEMWTYVGARRGKKRRSVWIWTAVVEEKDGERWADFEVGEPREGDLCEAVVEAS